MCSKPQPTGATALIRIPLGAHSRASVLVRLSTAALAAPVCLCVSVRWCV